MGKLLTRSAAAGLGLALALAGLVGWLAWRESDRQAGAAARAAHARQVLAALDGLAGELADADACRCACLLRVEPDQPERFRAAADGARRRVERLRELSDDGEADQVADLVERKLTLLERSLQLRQRQRFADRVQLALSRQLQELNEAIRGSLAAMRVDEDRALDQQTRAAGASARQAGAVVGAGGLLALLTLGLSAAGASHALVARGRSEAAAREGQRQAEARAAELTALREKLEEGFRRAQRLACVGQATSEVAHDFNNLLTVILSCSETSLRGLPPDDPARPFLAEVVEAGHRAAVLIRQLLAVGRGRPDAPAPRDLNLVVTELEPLLRRLAGRPVEVGLNLAPGLAPVWIDRPLIEQALLNLVANARDAMPEGGKMCIETRPGGDGWVVLSISDTGCGMDEQTRSRVFEPFFSTKGDGKGTGLGMAIVLGAAQRCGGRVEVDSAPGRGTTVRLFLRLAEAAASR